MSRNRNKTNLYKMELNGTHTDTKKICLNTFEQFIEAIIIQLFDIPFKRKFSKKW